MFCESFFVHVADLWWFIFDTRLVQAQSHGSDMSDTQFSITTWRRPSILHRLAKLQEWCLVVVGDARRTSNDNASRLQMHKRLYHWGTFRKRAHINAHRDAKYFYLLYMDTCVFTKSWALVGWIVIGHYLCLYQQLSAMTFKFMVVVLESSERRARGF